MRLDRAEEDGQTLRAHLAAAAQQTGRPDPRLLSTPPRLGLDIWRTYCVLNRRRPASLNGLVCVPPSEILALQQLQGVALTPWEVDTLMCMDEAAVSAYHAKDTAQ